MRLFFGIELPDDVRRSAAAVARDLDERLRRAAPDASLRWVDAQNLHITLWFLGEVADAKVTDVRSALTEPLRSSGFDLRLGGVGVFPDRGPLRVLWLGIQSGMQPLQKVYDEIGARLAPLGFQPEKRAFAAHVTLARFKESSGSAGGTVRRALDTPATDVARCPVTAVTLFRSHLSPKGSQYESLLRVPLA